MSRAVHDSASVADTEVVRLLQQLRDVPERDTRSAAAGRTRYLLEACRLQAQRSAPTRRLSWPWLRGVLSPRVALRFVLPVSCAVIACCISARVAADALPGDFLYPVKAAAEAVQGLSYGPGPRAAAYHLRLSERRLSEAGRLAALGRHDDLPAAVASYEREIDAATAMLGELSAAADDAAAVLALQLSDSLSDNESELTAMAAQVPDEARRSIDHARQVTAAGVEAARAALSDQPLPDGIGEVAATPLPTATGRGSGKPATPIATALPTPADGNGHGKPTAIPTGPVVVATQVPTAAAAQTATPEATVTEPAHGNSSDAPGQERRETAGAAADATGLPTETVTPLPTTSAALTATPTVHVPPGQATKEAETAAAPTSTPEPAAATPTVHVPPGQATKQAESVTAATPVPTQAPTAAPTEAAATATPVPTEAGSPGPTPAPTDDSPGRSGEAPGHQKDK